MGLSFFSKLAVDTHDLETRTVGGIQVVVPRAWSTNAVSILVSKYFRRAGVPKHTTRVEEEHVPVWLQRSVPAEGTEFGGETDARAVFHRLAGAWTYWGWNTLVFQSESDARCFYNEIYAMLFNQMAAPNSPQWFNTGLAWAYGITKESTGYYYVDPATQQVIESADLYEHVGLHACHIQRVEDDLVASGGIMDWIVREAKVFKVGAGSGANVSKIRAAGEPLSGGGRSSGLMGFLKIADRSAGAIKSGGTTRRAAKLLCLDLDHPDVEEFIDWKVNEEHKVASLITGSTVAQRLHEALVAATTEEERDEAVQSALELGMPEGAVGKLLQALEQGEESRTKGKVFDLHFEGEAYESVSGQNANNSLRVPDAFMRLLEEPDAAKRQWELTWRTGGVARTVDALALWDKMCYAAWSCADPGVQYDDHINRWNTCPNDGRINGANPCSEYHHLDDTSCNLASLNVLKFMTSTGEFDWDLFAWAVRLWTVVLDISVSMAHLPSPALAMGAYKYRNLGLGYANLGALLMSQALPYDSDAGRQLASNITSLMGAASYRTSVELAQHLGPFPRFEANRTATLDVIMNHGLAAARDAKRNALALSLWSDALREAEVYGVRNAQTTLLAPTGTIGFVMDCDTTGVEPDFALVKHKQLVGGGTMLIVNQTVPAALTRLGYTEEEREQISKYMLGTRRLPPAVVEELQRAGYQDIEAFNNQVQSAFDLRNVLPMAVLGWNEARIEAENALVLGQLTVEGAPDLDPADLPVFDCASRSGRIGTRSISWRAHIQMLAAVQPYLSGSISKTINMPRESTVQDVSEAYKLAWDLGVKCVAIYRDGSKLSAPMSSGVRSKLLRTKNTAQKVEVLAEHAARRVLESIPVTHRTPTREKLPDRRTGYTQKAVIAGHKVYLRTGEYPDGRLGELFIDMHKEGSTLRALMDCFAIAISMGLQYGVPLERFVEQFTFTRFEPAGMVFGHDRLQMSTSILDFVFRDLAINYLDRHDLAHVTADDVRSDAMTPEVSAEATLAGTVTLAQIAEGGRSRRSESQMAGYLTGDVCTACGSTQMVQSGKCTKCVRCGETSGCS